MSSLYLVEILSINPEQPKGKYFVPEHQAECAVAWINRGLPIPVFNYDGHPAGFVGFSNTYRVRCQKAKPDTGQLDFLLSHPKDYTNARQSNINSEGTCERQAA